LVRPVTRDPDAARSSSVGRRRRTGIRRLRDLANDLPQPAARSGAARTRGELIELDVLPELQERGDANTGWLIGRVALDAKGFVKTGSDVTLEDFRRCPIALESAIGGQNITRTIEGRERIPSMCRTSATSATPCRISTACWLRRLGGAQIHSAPRWNDRSTQSRCRIWK
jgi:hypothetical protein